MYTYEERSALARRVVMDGVRTLYPSWFYTIDVSPGPVSDLFGMKAWMLLIEEHLKWPSLIPVSKIDIQITREELVIEALEIQNLYQDNDETVQENAATKVCFAERQYLVGNQDEDSIHSYKILGMMKDLQTDLRDKKEISDKRDLVLRYLEQDQHMVEIIRLMEIESQRYPRVETVTQFLRMRYQDDIFVDSVPGLRKMTKDFLLGKISEDTLNIITEFLDIRQCMMEYGVNTVLVKDMNQSGDELLVLDNYLIDMLVRNGFFVVDNKYKSGRLKKGHICERRYGIYKTLADDVEHIVYIKKNDKNFVCDASYMFEYRGRNMMSIFTRTLMYPGIEDGEFGLLPSSDPSQGQVICVYPPLREYDVNALVRRAQDCLEHRYQYFIDNKIWPSKDILAEQCGYNLKIIFPKRGWDLKCLDRYKGKDDMYKNSYCGYLDERYAVNSIIRRIYQSEDKLDFIIGLMRNWKNPSNYWLGIWIKRYFYLCDVLLIIQDKDPRLIKLIWEAARLYRVTESKRNVKREHRITMEAAEKNRIRDKFRRLQERIPIGDFPWAHVKDISLCLL